MRDIGFRTAGARVMIATALVAAGCAVTALWPVAALADGALAIGQPADVAKQGFAFGITSNVSTPALASDKALDLCKNAKAASNTARSACKVVTTLHQNCAAVAMDPEKGTPGAGWAVAFTKKTAESDALKQCYLTAGSNRQSYCVVSASMCDTGEAPRHSE